jgi:[protein-PII] uridylyltransferase
VATQVGDLRTLRLLYALARADAAATGPAAWSRWKGRLAEELVSRVAMVLRGAPLPPPPRPDPALVAGPLPAVHLDGDQVTVVAAGRRGLLAGVAGCLALHRLDVVGADAAAVAGRALVRVVVQPRFGVWPDPAALSADLRRVAAGDRSPIERLRVAGRSGSGAGPRAGPTVVAPTVVAPTVVWHRAAATDAVILELRAPDSPGLLFRVANALDQVGAEVRAARVSTLGADVVDAFYLAGSWTGPAERDRVETAVLTATAILVAGGHPESDQRPRSR